MKIEAVDLFCGAGGLTAGLTLAGITVKAGYDIDQACKYPFEFNNKSKFVLKSVSDVSGSEISDFYDEGSIKVLAGCAPCQPFSTYNQGKDTRGDKKWPLLYEFARLIKESSPDIVTMENVPDVVRHEVYEDFILSLKEMGFINIWAKTVLCADYGLPQGRKRHVLIASRFAKGGLELIPPTHSLIKNTVRMTIGHLPMIEAGEVCKTDRLHKAAELSDLNLKRIKISRQGGSWRDWPYELRAECHKKKSGSSYASVYGRMSWDEPSPTITTLCYGFGNGRFGHPEQNRGITLREAALLQSFPIDYQFVSDEQPVQIKTVGRLIGNAVPVRLGEIIGMSIKNHIKSAFS